MEEACEIDRATGTNYWSRAIETEINNVRIAIDKLDNVSEEQVQTGKVRPGYLTSRLTGIFIRKARLVADGYKIAPTSITY